eukprot:scaffold4096_cov88-Isochrysis_galbana.AAC.4
MRVGDWVECWHRATQPRTTVSTRAPLPPFILGRGWQGPDLLRALGHIRQLSLHGPDGLRKHLGNLDGVDHIGRQCGDGRRVVGVGRPQLERRGEQGVTVSGQQRELGGGVRQREQRVLLVRRVFDAKHAHCHRVARVGHARLRLRRFGRGGGCGGIGHLQRAPPRLIPPRRLVRGRFAAFLPLVCRQAHGGRDGPPRRLRLHLGGVGLGAGGGGRGELIRVSRDQPIERVQVKGGLQRPNVDLGGQGQQTDGTAVDFGRDGFVLAVLRLDQLSDEVLTVSRGEHLGDAAERGRAWRDGPAGM